MKDPDVRIEKFKHFLATRHLSPATARAYCKPLRKFFRFADSRRRKTVDGKLVSAFRHSIQGQAAATRHIADASLRRYFEWLCDMGAMLSNPMNGIRPVKVKKLSYRPTLTPAEASRLLAIPDVRKPMGIRNRAILEVLYSSGIRRQELLRLTAYDLDLKGGFLMVRAGKNRKDRKVPLGKAATRWVQRYLETARSSMGTVQSSPNLFLSRQGNGMRAIEMCRMIHAAAKKAGIRINVTPHVFRHTAATEMVRNGAPLRYVQELLGHADIGTTQVYTKVTNPDLKAMILACHPSMRFKHKPVRFLVRKKRKSV